MTPKTNKVYVRVITSHRFHIQPQINHWQVSQPYGDIKPRHIRLNAKYIPIHREHPSYYNEVSIFFLRNLVFFKSLCLSSLVYFEFYGKKPCSVCSPFSNL